MIRMMSMTHDSNDDDDDDDGDGGSFFFFFFLLQQQPLRCLLVLEIGHGSEIGPMSDSVN